MFGSFEPWEAWGGGGGGGSIPDNKAVQTINVFKDKGLIGGFCTVK